MNSQFYVWGAIMYLLASIISAIFYIDTLFFTFIIIFGMYMVFAYIEEVREHEKKMVEQ